MNPMNPSPGDLRFWDGVAWIPVQDPKANALHRAGVITSLPLAKRSNRIIPISFGAFFAGCLVFGIGHYLLASRVHGACALDATPYQLTYTEACK